MGQFRDWVGRRRPRYTEDFDDDGRRPDEKFKYNAGNDVAGDYDRDVRELAKVVMAKYRSEFTRFLTTLADERNDGEIRSLLKRVDGDTRSPDPWRPDHPTDADEFVPPNADRGAEMGGGAP